MERLHQQYNKDIVPKLQKEFGFKNRMQVPKVTKIILNVGVGKIAKDAKFIDSIVADFGKITGQAPVKTVSRKSIAGFKLREGQIVGIMATLRGERMYAFLDKLINVALPRVKDFRGLSASAFDGRGNYHIGLKEQIVFPEISPDAIEHLFGLEVSIVTDAKKNDSARALLKHMSFPFRPDEKAGK
jgi:large subunit ribosomal protein L5